MKVFKFFIILSVIISISYFSWGYYVSRSNQGKYQKATLVFGDYRNAKRTSEVESLLCI